MSVPIATKELRRRPAARHPFRRINTLVSAVNAIRARLNTLAIEAGDRERLQADLILAERDLGGYTSRGHGFGLRFVHVSHDNGGKKCNNGGAGVPHQNKRECGRRQAQHRRGIIDFNPLLKS